MMKLRDEEPIQSKLWALICQCGSGEMPTCVTWQWRAVEICSVYCKQSVPGRSASGSLNDGHLIEMSIVQCREFGPTLSVDWHGKWELWTGAVVAGILQVTAGYHPRGISCVKWR